MWRLELPGDDSPIHATCTKVPFPLPLALALFWNNVMRVSVVRTLIPTVPRTWPHDLAPASGCHDETSTSADFSGSLDQTVLLCCRLQNATFTDGLSCRTAYTW